MCFNWLFFPCSHVSFIYLPTTHTVSPPAASWPRLWNSSLLHIRALKFNLKFANLKCKCWQNKPRTAANKIRKFQRAELACSIPITQKAVETNNFFPTKAVTVEKIRYPCYNLNFLDIPLPWSRSISFINKSFVLDDHQKRTCSSQAGWGEDTQELLSPFPHFLLFSTIIKVTQSTEGI